MVVKGQSGLHPDSGLSDNYRIFFSFLFFSFPVLLFFSFTIPKDIYKDKSTPPVPLNVTLLMSDISTGANSYYIIQLAEKDEGKDASLSPFMLYKKWGRVGNDIFKLHYSLFLFLIFFLPSSLFILIF